MNIKEVRKWILDNRIQVLYWDDDTYQFFWECPSMGDAVSAYLPISKATPDTVCDAVVEVIDKIEDYKRARRAKGYSA